MRSPEARALFLMRGYVGTSKQRRLGGHARRCFEKRGVLALVACATLATARALLQVRLHVGRARG
jgi:hypothetical protein